MPEEQWSEPEKWVWREICAGRIADFNTHGGNELDPKSPDDWNEGRKLRSEFLREILFREPYRSAVPSEGVRICGARFEDLVDLAFGRLNHQVWLDKCRFESTADFMGLHINGWLSLGGSAFAGHRTDLISLILSLAEIDGLLLTGATVVGTLTMHRLEVGDLFMNEGATFQDVNLSAAKVGGGIDMSGATLAGTLNMNSLHVAQSLYMRGHNASFENVDLGGAKVGGQLDISSATVAGMLDMDSLEVGQSLLMRGPKAAFQDVDLRSAKIGGQLSLTCATVRGTLNMGGIEIRQHLFMSEGATFREVVLGGAKIGGQLDMSGATVVGTLNMNGLEVGGQLSLISATVAGSLTMNGLKVGDLLMRGPDSTFDDVDLTGAKVGGQLTLIGATVAGKLTMDSLEVGQALFMSGATFKKRINLIFSRIRSNLDLSGADFSGAEFSKFDLSATRIEGELRLGSSDHPPPRWRQGARLTLRNTHVGAVQDWYDGDTNTWPDEVQLNGFTYERLGGYGADAGTDMLTRDIHWYIGRKPGWLERYIRRKDERTVGWLERDPSYTPQPYEQLAAAYRAAGEPTKADQILYESRERARQGAAWPRWLGLSLLKWTIGYGLGHRYFWFLSWAIPFFLIGTLLLIKSSQGPTGNLDKAIYSLDQLLPIVQLMTGQDVVLTGGVLYYFVVHRLMGWFLGLFLVAGLAGLTQK